MMLKRDAVRVVGQSFSHNESGERIVVGGCGVKSGPTIPHTHNDMLTTTSRFFVPHMRS